MINQLLAGVHIAVSGEAMALAIRAGADPQTVYDVITTSAGNSWMFQNRVPHVLAGDDTPHSAVNIFVKDLGIVLDQARTLGFPLPLAAAAHQLFLGAAALGHGAKDDAFVIRVWEALAGIDAAAGSQVMDDWGRLTQAQRDARYNNSDAVANSQEIVAELREASAAVRADAPGGLDQAYGAAERQQARPVPRHRPAPRRACSSSMAATGSATAAKGSRCSATACARMAGRWRCRATR